MWPSPRRVPLAVDLASIDAAFAAADMALAAQVAGGAGAGAAIAPSPPRPLPPLAEVASMAARVQPPRPHDTDPATPPLRPIADAANESLTAYPPPPLPQSGAVAAGSPALRLVRTTAVLGGLPVSLVEVHMERGGMPASPPALFVDTAVEPVRGLVARALPQSHTLDGLLSLDRFVEAIAVLRAQAAGEQSGATRTAGEQSEATVAASTGVALTAAPPAHTMRPGHALYLDGDGGPPSPLVQLAAEPLVALVAPPDDAAAAAFEASLRGAALAAGAALGRPSSASAATLEHRPMRLSGFSAADEAHSLRMLPAVSPRSEAGSDAMRSPSRSLPRRGSSSVAGDCDGDGSAGEPGNGADATIAPLLSELRQLAADAAAAPVAAHAPPVSRSPSPGRRLQAGDCWQLLITSMADAALRSPSLEGVRLQSPAAVRRVGAGARAGDASAPLHRSPTPGSAVAAPAGGARRHRSPSVRAARQTPTASGHASLAPDGRSIGSDSGSGSGDHEGEGGRDSNSSCRSGGGGGSSIRDDGDGSGLASSTLHAGRRGDERGVVGGGRGNNSDVPSWHRFADGGPRGGDSLGHRLPPVAPASGLAASVVLAARPRPQALPRVAMLPPRRRIDAPAASPSPLVRGGAAGRGPHHTHTAPPPPPPRQSPHHGGAASSPRHPASGNRAVGSRGRGRQVRLHLGEASAGPTHQRALAIPHSVEPASPGPTGIASLTEAVTAQLVAAGRAAADDAMLPQLVRRVIEEALASGEVAAAEPLPMLHLDGAADTLRSSALAHGGSGRPSARSHPFATTAGAARREHAAAAALLAAAALSEVPARTAAAPASTPDGDEWAALLSPPASPRSPQRQPGKVSPSHPVRPHASASPATTRRRASPSPAAGRGGTFGVTPRFSGFDCVYTTHERPAASLLAPTAAATAAHGGGGEVGALGRRASPRIGRSPARGRSASPVAGVGEAGGAADGRLPARSRRVRRPESSSGDGGDSPSSPLVAGSGDVANLERLDSHRSREALFSGDDSVAPPFASGLDADAAAALFRQLLSQRRRSAAHASSRSSPQPGAAATAAASSGAGEWPSGGADGSAPDVVVADESTAVDGDDVTAAARAILAAEDAGGGESEV